MKTEYITGSCSYRDLAEKYGVFLTTIADRGKKEGWVELRKQHRNTVVTKALRKDADRRAERLIRLLGASDRLLDKLYVAIDELDAPVATKKERIKTDEVEVYSEYDYIREGEKGIVDRLGARHIASAILDLQKVMTARPDLDEEEQQAKIARIRKDTEDSGKKEVRFHLDGGLEDFGD